MREVEIGDPSKGGVRAGPGLPLVWMAGPAVIEDAPVMKTSAERLKKLSERLRVPLIFRSSYDRDDRPAESAYHGPGLDLGLERLDWIRREFELPVMADVSRTEELGAAREVLDAIEIPPSLCQQTHFVVAAGQTGKPVNVRRGPFVAPRDMSDAVAKLERAGNPRVLLTERGAGFGYDQFVADMTSIPALQELGCPVFFDAGDPVRRSGDSAAAHLATLLRAAIAAGANGICLATHPDPAAALYDGAQPYPLEAIEDLMITARDLAELIREQGHA